MYGARGPGLLTALRAPSASGRPDLRRNAPAPTIGERHWNRVVRSDGGGRCPRLCNTASSALSSFPAEDM